MDLWKKMIQMFQVFADVVAGTTISAAFFISVFNPDWKFAIIFLWQIIAIAAACALGNLFYYIGKIPSKKQMRFRIICHYVYIIFVVIGGGYLFDWLTPGDILEFIVMLLLVTVVYVIITAVSICQGKRMAENLNRELQRRYPSREEDI